MIVSKLQLLEVIREPLRGDSVVFHDTFLDVTPEASRPMMYTLPREKYFVSMIVEKASLVIAESGPPVSAQFFGSCR